MRDGHRLFAVCLAILVSALSFTVAKSPDKILDLKIEFKTIEIYCVCLGPEGSGTWAGCVAEEIDASRDVVRVNATMT